jgi:hypothetical protein
MPARSLKEKSINNIESADLLVKKGYFDASVHCSYYGCLQLIKLVLNVQGRIGFDTQRQESHDAREGSHSYYLSKFKSVFKGGELKTEVQTQTNEINKLRELRVQADYDPEKVDPGKCSTAVASAKLFSEFVFGKIKIKV